MTTATATAKAIELKNILFATDFSPAAAAAFPYAVALAEEFGAKLYAVHAKTPENYALPATEVWPIANAQLEHDTTDLKRTLEHIQPPLETEIIVLEGGVTAVVEAVAEAKKADLIILGTSGRRGIGKFILGSTAEDILRRANCPVLTVGPHVAVGTPREMKFRRILYATDFSETTPLAVAYAIGLAHEHAAHLTLLHVIDHLKAGELVTPHELETAALNRLNLFVEHEPGLAFPPKIMVAHGAPADKILDIAKKEGAELIVLGVRRNSGTLRATHLPAAIAHRVISEAACPVLTIRA
ncbi:MAG TPA: universal stress protein [Candidatus Eremiobacteraceae bacterium]|nr:universal stress protein [Candidatus Eremiobacteraceae bacterium]